MTGESTGALLSRHPFNLHLYVYLLFFTLLLFFSIGEERTDFSALWDFLAV